MSKVVKFLHMEIFNIQIHAYTNFDVPKIRKNGEKELTQVHR